MAKDYKNLKVSILIPLYNSENYIAETIESALGQSWENIEIIVVDDGSTDRSYEIAKNYEAENVKIIKQENKGGAGARNVAFELSGGDYIQYLDADDILPPDKISKQLSILQKHDFDPGILTFCRFTTFVDSFDEVWENSFPIYYNYLDPMDLLINVWLKSSYVISHAWLCHRDMIRAAGSWNESLTLNDDGEFFSRVINQAKQINYCDDCFVYYRHTPNSVSKRKDKTAIQSWFESLGLISDILLNSGHKNASEASSIAYSRFMYKWYPENRFLLHEVKMRIREKELHFVVPAEHNSRFYITLKHLFGWKGAKSIIGLSKKIIPAKLRTQLSQPR